LATLNFDYNQNQNIKGHWTSILIIIEVTFFYILLLFIVLCFNYQNRRLVRKFMVWFISKAKNLSFYLLWIWIWCFIY